MAIVRLEALNHLRDAIVCAIPELRNRVCVGQRDAGGDLGFPHMVLDPIRWKYEPHQADEVFDPAPDRVVVNVGYHEGTVQIRIGAKNAYERMELEQKVLDVFLSPALSPGVLVTPVLTCPALGEFVASWVLDNDEWDDRQAFSQQYYSQVVCTGVVPALVTRGSSHTIEDLRLGLTENFDSTIDEDNFDTSPLLEIVTINQDGSIEAV